MTSRTNDGSLTKIVNMALKIKNKNGESKMTTNQPTAKKQRHTHTHTQQQPRIIKVNVYVDVKLNKIALNNMKRYNLKISVVRPHIGM